MLGQGLESCSAYPGWGLLQLNPHVGFPVLVHKLHQLLGVITPDQHHGPSQPQGLLQLQRESAHRGCCVRTSPSPVTSSSSARPPPNPAVPGYLLRSGSVLSDVKEDGAGSSLPCHSGLRGHTEAGRVRGGRSPYPPARPPSRDPAPSAPLRPPHARGPCPECTQVPLPSRTALRPSFCNGTNPSQGFSGCQVVT